MLTLRRSDVRAARSIQKPAGSVRRFLRKERVAGYLFIAPWIIGFLLFYLFPLLDTIYISFTDMKLFGTPIWIGLQNYQELFSSSSVFFQATGNMVLYVVLATLIYIVGGLGLALLLHRKFPGSQTFRVIFYLPSLMVGVATGAMFVQVFNGQNYGLINEFLAFIHLPTVNWLNNYNYPIVGLIALIITTAWFTGGTMLIFIAGLKGISPTYYDAARVDGAGPWQRFRSITLPLLTPVILFNTLLTLIGHIQVFETALIFAGGGSGSVGSVTSVLGYHDSLATYLTYLFQEGILFHHYGFASALAIVVFLITLALTALVLIIFKPFTFYQGAPEG